jgi:alpha-1,3-rhamnosyl/mannosyltransferase
VVATLHDLIPWAYGGRALLGERLRYWPGRRLLKRADAVLAVSESTAADARRLGAAAPSRIHVVPEGVAGTFRPSPAAAEQVRARFGIEPGYLLYVGSLDSRKDPRALMAAWQVVRGQGRDVPLVLAGLPGAQAPAGMDGAVRLGHVPDADLADLYGAAGCLVFASRYEGFGLPVLEAMACGCPVVAYSNSSLPEVAGDAAELVPDGDSAALGRAAAGFLGDLGRRARARRRGIAWARRFTWRQTAELTVRAYEDVLHD